MASRNRPQASRGSRHGPASVLNPTESRFAHGLNESFATQSPESGHAGHEPLGAVGVLVRGRVLCLKSALRLERRGEQGQEET